MGPATRLLSCIVLAALGCGGQSKSHAGGKGHDLPDPQGGSSGSSGSDGSGGSGGSNAGGGTSGAGGTGGGPTVCDGLEVDLRSSPRHCGACGNDCRQGGCNDGVCSPTPTLIATYTTRPDGPWGLEIALDETRVYFTDPGGGRVGSVAKDGGDERDVATAFDEPSSIAVDGEFVYFSTEGDSRVVRVPKDGGEPALISNQEPRASDLAAIAGDLYWRSGDAVRRAERGTPPPTVIASQPSSRGLEVDESLVYWIVRDQGSELDGIHAADRFGMGNVGRRVPAANLSTFAVSGRELYATTFDYETYLGNVAMVFPREQDLAVDLLQPENISVDATHVIFSLATVDAIIRKIPRGGGTATTLASVLVSDEGVWALVADLELDETRVFFATTDGIYSVPK